MNRTYIAIGTTLAVAAAGILTAVLGGCIGTIGRNQLVERTGNVTVVFINNTPYQAAFSYGSYDAWDRSPGAVNFEQLTVPANTSSTAATLPCARNVAVGTDDFVARVIATKADETATAFDPDAFDTTVHFSSAPAGSAAASLPTAGSAVGAQELLGVDYSCEDRLIFTFVEDPDAPGGFRIDYEVILDVIKN